MGVRSEIDDGLRLIWLDNPPVNALSQPVRRSLLAEIEAARGDAGLRGVIVIGAGRVFSAGADINEFDAPEGRAPPALGDVVDALEALPVPVLAAIHGVALGGGLELAMGAHARIALPGTRLGLPETAIGVIPGAGGTQRLPRLVGMLPALEAIVTAQPWNEEAALALGLIDRIAARDLRATAIAFLREFDKRRLRRSRERPLPAPDEVALATLRRRAEESRKHEVAPRLAIQSVLNGLNMPIDAALERERELFEEARRSPQSAALRYLFFAERRSGRLPGLPERIPPISKIGIVGGGTMGRGIAIACARKGFPVRLSEIDAAAADRAASALSELFRREVERGRLSAAEAARAQALIVVGAELGELAACDLVIEAILEDLEAKAELLRQLDVILPAGTILASNSSSLDLDRLASVTGRADSVLGIHFFNPAPVMRLVEIVRTRSASPATLARSLEFVRRLEKIAVVVAVGPGFAANRMADAYFRAAERELANASPAAIDEAVEAYGFALGPFATMDLIGLDVVLALRREIAGRETERIEALVQAGRLGRKSGGGWLNRGSAPSEPASPATLERLLDAIRASAREILDEKIVTSPEAIDVIWANGFGFPRWRGGPLYEGQTRVASMSRT